MNLAIPVRGEIIGSGNYFLRIFAENGMFQENIDTRFCNGMWDSAIKVFKNGKLLKKQNVKPECHAAYMN